jgi:hypothetical protein
MRDYHPSSPVFLVEQHSWPRLPPLLLDLLSPRQARLLPSCSFLSSLPPCLLCIPQQDSPTANQPPTGSTAILVTAPPNPIRPFTNGAHRYPAGSLVPPVEKSVVEEMEGSLALMEVSVSLLESALNMLQARRTWSLRKAWLATVAASEVALRRVLFDTVLLPVGRFRRR